MATGINLKAIPKLYRNTYIGKIDDCIFVYTATQKKGIVVLKNGLIEIFNMVDGKHNLEQIYKKIHPYITKNQLFEIFRMFEKHNIIYFNQPSIIQPVLSRRENLAVWMQITNECNLRCKYCPLKKNSELMSDETIDLSLKKFVALALKYKFRSITIKLAGGEPLIRLKQIKKIVNKIKLLTQKKPLKINLILLTNGILITDNLAQWFKRKNIGIGVSLDGLAESHDANRVFVNGQGSFSRVLQGIGYLQKHDVMFSANITITKKNVSHIPTLVRYLLEKKILFRLSFYIKCDLATEELKPKNQDLIKYLRRAYYIILKNPPKNLLIDNLLDMVSFYQPRQQKCGVGIDYLIISSDGKIQTCPLDDTSIIGSLFKTDDFIQTIHNKSWSNSRHLSVPDFDCIKCPWRYVCCGGCPLHSYNTSKQLIAHSNYCSVYKTLIPEVLKIEARRLLIYHDLPSS